MVSVSLFAEFRKLPRAHPSPFLHVKEMRRAASLLVEEGGIVGGPIRHPLCPRQSLPANQTETHAVPVVQESTSDAPLKFVDRLLAPIGDAPLGAIKGHGFQICPAATPPQDGQALAD